MIGPGVGFAGLPFSPTAPSVADARTRSRSRGNCRTISPLPYEDAVESNRSITPRARRPWTSPVVADLPRLTDLTLTTGSPIPGDGGTGGTGSTVVP